VKASDFVNNNANFTDVTFIVEEGQLVITPLTGVLVTVQENSGEFVYDGTEKVVTGYTVKSISDSVYTEADFSFNGVAEAKGTVVGSYDMNVLASDFVNNNPNFEDVNFFVLDGQLVITPVETVITVKANDDSKVYDGTALTNPGFSYTPGILKEGDVLTAVVEGSQTDAGSSANVVTSWKVMRGDVDVTSCYTFGPAENGVLQVTKRTVVLTSGTDSKTYDGTPLTKEEVSVSGEGFVDGEGAGYSDFASITNVGSVDNTFKYTLNEGTKADNYNISTELGKLTVAAMGSVVVTITEHSGTYTYDGTEKVVTGYDVSCSTPLYTDADFSFSGLAEVKGTVVGTYDMELKAEDFANTNANFTDVKFVIVDGQLVINPIAAEIVVSTESAEKVYDGTPLTKDSYSYTEGVLVEGDELVVVVSGTQTDAGSSANAISSCKVMRGDMDVTDCYTFGKSVDGTLTVTPKAVTITTGSASKEYDGTALTCDKITVEGFVGDDGADVTVTGSRTEVGSSKNTAEYSFKEGTNADNYTVTLIEGTLTVTPESAPKTGDDSHNGLWAALMGVSALGIAGIAVLRRKEEDEA
ncbi:MAG: LPXTG cell wall anchor domain-containing protein, partial [Oscillospiraceae bacterium]|nr:LPXTG cell wall anchor domain-containing protein [Oscillospiraceae bacterium]